MYLLRLPKPIQWLFPKAVYDIENKTGQVYLTFDDGPIPEVTPWVLDQLAQYSAKATFFMVGENVQKHPDIYDRIIQAGHRVGNHTYHHLKGTKVSNQTYLDDIKKAAEYIDSNIFRPPYGQLRPSQARQLMKKGYSLCFWSLLSGDFDTNIDAERCLQNVLTNIRPGDVVVFHDSLKAWPRLSYVLPKVLAYCKTQSWSMAAMD